MSLLVRTGFLLLISMQLACAQGEVLSRPRIEINPSVFKRYEEFASWTPMEWSLLRDVADSKLNQHSLFDASLVVAGHGEKSIQRLRNQLTDSIRQCRGTIGDDLATRVKLRQVFAHISRNFLGGDYRADLYDVGRTVSGNEFNCLTASILFHAHCRALSLDVSVLWEPSHVQCWSSVSNHAGYIIETTAASPENAISDLTRSDGLKSRRLSSTEFVGKIFYNRGVRALTSDRYPEALVSTWACCVLDINDRPAQSNLRACINNWALMAAQHRNVAMVQRLFDIGLELDPNYEPFSRNKALLLGGTSASPF